MNPGAFNGMSGPSSALQKFTGRNWAGSSTYAANLTLPAFQKVLGDGYGAFAYTVGVRTLVARATGKGLLRFAGIATSTATSGNMTCELWVDGKLVSLASGISSSSSLAVGFMLAGMLRYGNSNTDILGLGSNAAPLIYSPDSIPFTSSVEMYFTGATGSTGYRAFCVDFYE